MHTLAHTRTINIIKPLNITDIYEKTLIQSMLMLSLQDPSVTVGGSGDTGPRQLTREMGGWSSENWSDVEEGEEF